MVRVRQSYRLSLNQDLGYVYRQAAKHRDRMRIIVTLSLLDLDLEPE